MHNLQSGIYLEQWKERSPHDSDCITVVIETFRTVDVRRDNLCGHATDAGDRKQSLELPKARADLSVQNPVQNALKNNDKRYKMREVQLLKATHLCDASNEFIST